MNLQVYNIGSYLHWFGVWLHFIYHLGKSRVEHGDISNYQSYCTKPKKLKCGEVRRPNIPFFKRILHRKIVSCNKFVTPVGSYLYQYFDGWADKYDNDTVSLPYCKYLHYFVLIYM